MKFLNHKNNSSFTLIELLVVLALVAILSVVVVMTLNPAELIKQARDSNRLSDLATINTALNLFSADVTSGFMGTSTVVYVSIPDTSPTCANLGLPALPTSTIVYTYNCATSANLRNTNGTGWIPVNFQRISSNSPISQLPIDPINTTTTGNYYTYVSGGSWILTAIPESVKQKADLSVHPQITSYPGVIGMGNNLNLSPLFNSTGLVGYWKFDEGSGASVVDSSGTGNNGVVSLATWMSQGKVGGALDFTPGAGFIDIPHNSSLNIPNTLTISAWVNYISTPVASAQTNPMGKWNGTNDANYVWYWYSNGYAIPGSSLIIANAGGNWAALTPGQTVPSGSGWRLLTFTYNSAGLAKTYINGVQVQSFAAAGALATNNAVLKIGYMGTDFHATMDDIRIYNRELVASEIIALYNATK